MTAYDVKFGTFDLNSGNYGALRETPIRSVGPQLIAPELVASEGAVVTYARYPSRTLELNGYVLGSDFEAMQDNRDALIKALGNGVQDLRLGYQDERYWRAQLVGDVEQDGVAGPRLWKYRAAFKASDPFAFANSAAAAATTVRRAGNFEAGSSAKLTIADNASVSLGNVAMVYAAWVTLESKPANQMRIMQHWLTTGNNRAAALFWDNVTDRFAFSVSHDGTSSVATVTANNFGAPSQNTRYLVIAWHDPAVDKIFISINGGTADEAAANAAGIFAAAANFTIGAQADGTLAFDGVIDEAGFWKGGFLDATNRTALYNSGLGLTYDALTPGLLTNLVSWWSMDNEADIGDDTHTGGNNLTNTSVASVGGLVEFTALVSGDFRKSLAVTPGGNIYARPVITITVPTMGVNRTIASIAVVNATANPLHWLTVERTFADGEVLVINSAAQTVQVDGVDVDFHGAFPLLDPRAGTTNELQVLVDSTLAPSLDVEVDWRARWAA